jgi:hypothetical protein
MTACPYCAQPIVAHWSLSMTPEQLDEWNVNTKVCTRTRGEVMELLHPTKVES